MLLHLHIQNYAIIEEIAIDFSEGLQAPVNPSLRERFPLFSVKDRKCRS
jgi:hypothetical protein